MITHVRGAWSTATGQRLLTLQWQEEGKTNYSTETFSEREVAALDRWLKMTRIPTVEERAEDWCRENLDAISDQEDMRIRASLAVEFAALADDRAARGTGRPVAEITNQLIVDWLREHDMGLLGTPCADLQRRIATALEAERGVT